MPKSCPNVPSEILSPKNTWKDKNAYDKKANILAKAFNDNFIQFSDHANKEILNAWGAYTLKHRCILFHRKFLDHRINPTLLTRIYKMHKIKRKKVKFVKQIEPSKEIEYEEWRQENQ